MPHRRNLTLAASNRPDDDDVDDGRTFSRNRTRDDDADRGSASGRAFERDDDYPSDREGSFTGAAARSRSDDVDDRRTFSRNRTRDDDADRGSASGRAFERDDDYPSDREERSTRATRFRPDDVDDRRTFSRNRTRDDDADRGSASGRAYERDDDYPSDREQRSTRVDTRFRPDDVDDRRTFSRNRTRDDDGDPGSTAEGSFQEEDFSRDRVARSTRDADSRRAFRRALDAMEDWRRDLMELTDRHSENVFGRMAIAAESIGWPKTIVEASKNELMPAARAQTQLIDQMIDDWRDRLSDPEFIEPPQKMMPAGQPETNANLALAPAQAWLEATAAWQKHWADAMRAWTTNSHRAGKGEG